VAGEAPLQGLLWYKRLEEAIQSLGEFPERHPIVTALSDPARVVRQFLFGRRRNAYRVFYTILNDTIEILHVRHGAREMPRTV
jgi:plasmid stabilization system protein ParE